MSDASSTVTYTSVYMDSEPWRYYKKDSAETGPPRVIVYGYDGLPIQPIAPPSPDYVPGPEHPPSPDYVPGPKHPPSPIEIPYVPEPKYPGYLEPSDDEAPLEDQPLPADVSPIAASLDYVADSDPEEDPEDDQADYPTDVGDGDDEPFDDDDDDDTDDEDPDEEPFEEDDEEEEHPAPVDSFVVPIVDLVLSAGEIEALEADEPTHARGSPISIPLSHAALLSPPLLVPSLPLPLPSPLTTRPTDTGAPLGYREAEIRMRALLLSTSRRTDIPEADMPPRKKACLTAPTPRFEIGESSTAGVARQPGPTKYVLRRCRVEQAGYGITDMWDEIVDKMMEIAPTTLEGVNERVTELDTTVRHGHSLWQEFCTNYPDYVTADPVDYGTWTHRGLSCMVINKMAPKKRTTRETPATATTPTITITNAQLQALINRGVAAALAERDADRGRNGDNSNDSGTIGRRQMNTPRECSYTNFLKCQPMSFHVTEGVAGSAFTWWNSYMRVVGQDVAYAMPWAALKRIITKATKVERYIGGLPDMIHGSVKVSKPQSMQEAIEFATEMMDKKMLTHVERQAEQKRKFDDPSRNNQHQQQPFKRNNVARAYIVGPGDKKPYEGTKPLCRPAAANNNNNQRAQGENARGITCFKCGVQGHYKNDCPKLKNGNQGNRAGNGNAVARAYAAGTAGTNLNSNVVTGTFLLNNRYALVLFDTGADRSFISTAFSSLIDIIPTTLDHGYDVELADEMGSFDVIISMDWLVKYHAVIVCDEKLVRVPFGGEILIFHGDGSNNGHKSRLNIISCTKTQRYLLKGYPIFLAHVTTKEAEDKSKEKQLEDVPIVQDFLEVFLEDMPGITLM
nr:hypothetical protein [Tanacetum cinerariifolium]